MKKKIPTLLSYNSTKTQYLQKQQFPLTQRMPVLTDLNSSSSINKELTTRQSYSKRKNYSLNQKKYKIDKKLLYIFKDPKEKYKKKFVWPKITHAKLPFSERPKISSEERKKKIMEKKPSNLFHNFYTIKWLRQKYSDSLIEKSVFSMLPDNGKPVVPDDESEEDRKHRLLMEYLESLYTKTPEREKYVNINPKYFFDKRTFEKILKFKAIFLEFDEDQSRKMEIDEMVEMFNQNHINANLRDLVNLFFKDQTIKEEDIMKLYLDFYQFMNFALTKDQDFREFMREIKLKNKKKEEGFGNNKEEEETNGYLPMNFNLMFDYFLIKGKERASIEAIENSITEMDKIINNEKNDEEFINDNIKEEKNNIKKEMSESKSQFLIEEENNDNSKYYDEQLKNLNFCDLMENFTNLFSVNDLTNNNDTKQHKKDENEKNGKNENESRNKKKKLNNESDETMTEYIQNKMNKNAIKKMNIKNYKKYHNVKLALNATKEQIKNLVESNENKVDNLYKIQINKENVNNKQMNTINNIFPILNKKPKKNKSNLKEKNLFKNKTSLLLNKNIIKNKEFFDKNKRTISIGNENKIKILDNNINNKDKYVINNYFSKNNFKNKFKKRLDYVPFELLKK